MRWLNEIKYNSLHTILLHPKYWLLLLTCFRKKILIMTKRHSEVNFKYHIRDFHKTVFWKEYLCLLKHLTMWQHTPQQNVCRHYRGMVWGFLYTCLSPDPWWNFGPWIAGEKFLWHPSGFSSAVPGYILDYNLLWNLTFTSVTVPCGLSWSTYKLSKDRDQKLVSPTLALVPAMDL